MDAQQFLAEFGHIANAPGGIERLRELIYQFAITGRLVPQQAEEGNADAVLENVASIRQQLIAEKRWKRAPKLESAPLNLPAIELPPTWRWSRLLDLGEINPRNLALDEAKATFVPMAAVSEKHGIAVGGEETDWASISKGYTHFANGDVLLAKITPCFENGKAAVVSGLKHDIGSGSTEFHVFRAMSEDVLAAYVYLFLRSPLFRVKGQSSMTGTAGQKRLPTDYFALCAMPLPPKAEQARIVAKVDELMSLCDKLEDEQQKRRKLQNTLRQATLQAVAKAQSPHELQTSWARLEANFGRLFSASDQVSNLRQLILDLAINGRLSEKNTLDEPVGELVRRCKDEKQRRLTDGEMKRKVSAATDVIQSEVTFPDHWTRVPLEDLFQFIDYRGNTPPKTSSGVALITAKNVRPGRLNPEPKEYISDSSYRDWMTRGFPRVGDLLFTTEAPLGNVARIEGSANFALAQRVIDFQPYADIDTQCAMYFMMSPTFQGLLEVNSTGMTAKGIKAAKLKRIEFPVPPVSEQARIVAKVESLLQLCDVLDEHLEESAQVAARASNAAVSSITGIAIEQEEDESVKVPQTELISRLRLGQAPSVKAQAPLASLLARQNGELSAQDLWQRYGGEIDAFYAQLKIEVAHGWIEEPAVAEVREITTEAV